MNRSRYQLGLLLIIIISTLSLLFEHLGQSANGNFVTQPKRSGSQQGFKHFFTNDAQIQNLIAHGYDLAMLESFDAGVSIGNSSFGGPNQSAKSEWSRVSESTTGDQYLFFQYELDDKSRCQLVFAKQDQKRFELLTVIDAASVGNIMGRLMNSSVESSPTPVWCLPAEWGDINQNGRPDIIVSFLWANRLAGSESHIFEIDESEQVVWLNRDLPGVISPWDMATNRSELIVWDFDWVTHDCFYPPLYLFRVFAWQQGSYRDVTAESEIVTEFLEDYIADMKAGFGGALNAEYRMKFIVMILIMYDRVGERSIGWSHFESLTDLENWPESTQRDTDWRNADYLHFEAQYRLGQAFTPNDFCPTSVGE